MEEKNRMNTVRTDRYMTPLETEYAASNLKSVEDAIHVKRDSSYTLADRIETYLIVGVLVVVVVLAMLGVGA